MIRLIPLLLLSFFALRCGTGTTAGSDDTNQEPTPQTTPVANPFLALAAASDTPLGDSTHLSDEAPVHAVTLAAFEMQTCEITWHELCQILNDTLVRADSGLTLSAGGVTLLYKGDTCLYLDSHFISAARIAGTPSYLDFTPVDVRRNYPVTSISWIGAALVCNFKSVGEKLGSCYDSLFGLHLDTNGYRLPTEAEWEHAARGGRRGDSALYPTGATIDRFHANYRWDVDEGDVVPVGIFPANPYGLKDLAGNVWEWCSDFYANSYDSLPGANNPVMLSPGADSARVLRGGSHGDAASLIRTASRAFSKPGTLNPGLGFRMVRRK